MPDHNPAPMPTRRSVATLQAVRDHTGGGFDIDAWHVMDQRDNALIADEVLSGSGSSKFVYQFDIKGTAVTGISVIGARHLAAHYGGIKHRLVGSVQKIGSLFTFTSYPSPGMPMEVRCAIVHELEDQDDYYESIVELADIKTGNAIQVQKRESRMERTRSGSTFERPHYQIISQAKAYRNGVLSLIPQDVQLKFKLQMLDLGKGDVITSSIFEEKRAGVLRFASSKSIAVDRHAVQQLTLPQINGLADAARLGVEDFKQAAWGLGIMRGLAAVEHDEEPARAAPAAAARQQAAAEPVKAEPGETRRNPAPAAQGRPAAAFEAYLVDEVGEVAGDVYMSPVLFAAAFVRLLETTPADAVPRVWENNDDALKLAASLSPEAKAALDAEQAQPDFSDVGPSPAAAMPLEKGGRGADVSGWVKAAVAHVATLGAEYLDDWASNNEPTFRSFPAPKRLEVTKALAMRRQALGGQPEAAEAVRESTPAEAEQDDEAWSYEVVGDAAALKTRAELMALVQQIRPRMDAMRTRAPDARKRVEGYLNSRLSTMPE